MVEGNGCNRCSNFHSSGDATGLNACQNDDCRKLVSEQIDYVGVLDGKGSQQVKEQVLDDCMQMPETRNNHEMIDSG